MLGSYGSRAYKDLMVLKCKFILFGGKFSSVCISVLSKEATKAKILLLFSLFSGIIFEHLQYSSEYFYYLWFDRSGIEPKSTVSVTDALSTRPLSGVNRLQVGRQYSDDAVYPPANEIVYHAKHKHYLHRYRSLANFVKQTCLNHAHGLYCDNHQFRSCP